MHDLHFFHQCKCYILVLLPVFDVTYQTSINLMLSRVEIAFMTLYLFKHSISSYELPSGIRGQLWGERLFVRIPPAGYAFFYYFFHLLSIPHSLKKPIQIKLSMAFIRHNKCTEIDTICLT